MKSNYDFSEFSPKKSKKYDFSEFGSSQENPDKVNTFLGQIPSSVANAKPGQEGSLSSREMIDESIAGLAGAPGMNLLSKFIGKTGSAVKNTAINAFKDIKPYEQKAEQALAEHTAATSEAKAAKALKPGIIEKPQSQLESIEDQLSRHLNVGGAHHIRAGEALKKRVGDIEKYWSDSYGNLVSKLSKSKFQMPKSELSELDKLNLNKSIKLEDYKKLIAKGRPFSEVEKEGIQSISKKMSAGLSDLMKRAPTSRDVNAERFLSKYKDFRNGLHDMRMERKVTPDEALRRQLTKDISKAEKTEGIIKDVLERGLGEHADEFKRVNKGYSEQVFPLRGNKVIRKLTRKEPGNLSGNMAKEFSGGGKSQELLRSIVKQDPELLRNVIGQRYALKPNEIHRPDEIMREYLNETPELQRLTSSKEKILKDIAKRKDISLENKVKTEKELDRLLSKKEKGKNALKAAGYTALGATGVPVLSKIMKTLGSIGKAGEI